jgi:hypothetical protein
MYSNIPYDKPFNVYPQMTRPKILQDFEAETFKSLNDNTSLYLNYLDNFYSFTEGDDWRFHIPEWYFAMDIYNEGDEERYLESRERAKILGY